MRSSVPALLRGIADVELEQGSAWPLTDAEWDARRKALEQQGREMLGT